MKKQRTRREFLADVAAGMLVAGVGVGTAADLGLATAWADDGPETLSFGALEPLVGLMQETPIDRLVPTLVERLRSGTDLGRLVAAAALANARTFGGEDYVGYHTMMALAPAYHMARELPESRRPLPVLKVLVRNTNRIQEHGGRPSEVLHPVEPAETSAGCLGAEALRDAVRREDRDRAERIFAALAGTSADAAFNDLLWTVQDRTEVHRVVLPYRAWDLMGLIGRDHAHTLLRQSVRYCVQAERWSRGPRDEEPKTLLPKLLDQYHLVGRPRGTREVDDVWVERISRTLFEASREQAADAAAAALAEGIAPDAVGEAISLAANQLVLRDAGRLPAQASAQKPAGSVHGDSIGVHACDSANAWRNMARASNDRNTVACLILGAYQVADDRINRGGEFLTWSPHPRPEDLEQVQATDGAGLLREAEAAIRSKNQYLACAAVHRYGELDLPSGPVFDLLLGFATSEDGALHAEKYYRTVREEFAATRAAFRWRQLVALARVTASEFGQPAPGYADACRLLGV